MGKKVLEKEKIDKIIFLRQRGHSLPEIRRITGHANGTVFKYIQGVKILPEFQEYWKSRRKSSTWRSEEQKKEAKENAKKLIKNLSAKEKILILASLYWAEGSKKYDLSLSNTDPDLIKTFVKCLEEVGIKKERISINIRIFSDLDREKCCKFWAKTVGIPIGKVKYVDVRPGKKNGKLAYGMCRVRVIKGGYFLKLINEIKNCIVENTI